MSLENSMIQKRFGYTQLYLVLDSWREEGASAGLALIDLPDESVYIPGIVTICAVHRDVYDERLIRFIIVVWSIPAQA